MPKNRRGLKILCAVLLCLNLLFIWGNSALPGGISAWISGSFCRINAIDPRAEDLVRKLAHFSEFACLGLLLAGSFLLHGQQGIHRFTMPLLCGLLAACLDETIQVFSPGRASRLLDVWIDTAGAAAGILCLLAGKAVYDVIKSKKQTGGTKQ